MLRQTIPFYTKRLSYRLQLFALFFLGLLLTTTSLAANGWKELSSGIEYRDLNNGFLTPWSHIHVFRINLKDNQFNLAMAKDLSREHASVDEYAHHANALISINGGFFDKKYRPLGLRIANRHQYNPLKRISWWGIFYIKHKKAHISTWRQFKSDRQIDFAVQSGPRLLINGRIPSLKPGTAERTALGITRDGKVIILVTDHAPLSTTELAKLMKTSPLDCKQALNLDGGNSSQLHASIGSFNLNVHGFSNVSDAIIVKAR